jgi:hypothetical protein
MDNSNLAAAGLPLMLFTIGGGAFAAIILVAALVRKNLDLAQHVAAGVALWSLCYVVLLLTASLTSCERVYYPGDWKPFCGFYLDCHLSVTVEEVKRLFPSAQDVNSSNEHPTTYTVTIRVSSNAGEAARWTVLPEAWMTDSSNIQYHPVQIVAPAGPTGFSLEPGHSVMIRYVFRIRSIA